MQNTVTENLPEILENETQVIVDRNGQKVTVQKMSRTEAIKLFCCQCLGFILHPDKCEVTTCPLFHYRGRTMIGALTDEQREERRVKALDRGFGNKQPIQKQ